MIVCSFLFHGVKSEASEVTIIRFTCLAFGVRSSPFLLNTILNHQMETYNQAEPLFVDKFLSSIHVYDNSFGADQVKSAY